MPISFGIAVTVYSGWELRNPDGSVLEYESTTTLGKNLGRWRVNFGLYVREMPGKIASRMFGTPEDVNPDVWIFR